MGFCRLSSLYIQIFQTRVSLIFSFQNQNQGATAETSAQGSYCGNVLFFRRQIYAKPDLNIGYLRRRVGSATLRTVELSRLAITNREVQRC